MSRIAALAILALLAAAPGAAADPPWSTPRNVSPIVGIPPAPRIVFAADGSALLSWNTGEPARGNLATLQADGAIVPHGRLPGEVVAQPLLLRDGRTVVLTRRRRTGRFREFDTLRATFGTTAAPRGRTRRVGPAHEVFGEDQGPAMAVAGDEVAIGWVEALSQERHRYRVAFSRGGRAFGRPRTLATGVLPTRDSESIALAYGRGRTLVAAYAGARRKDGGRPVIVVRTRRPGHGFGTARILGARQPLTDLAAAASPQGRIVVAWGSQDSGEEANRPWIVRAALRGPGRRFGRAAVLDPGATIERVRGHLAATMTSDGTAVLAWTNVRDDTFPLRAATAPPGARFGAATEISPNGVVGSLATHAGETILTWTDAEPDIAPSLPRDVFAALRPAGGAFGPPERVSSTTLEDFDPAVAAYDPASGRPAVLWPAGTDARDVRLQLSSRAG